MMPVVQVGPIMSPDPLMTHQCTVPFVCDPSALPVEEDELHCKYVELPPGAVQAGPYTKVCEQCRECRLQSAHSWALAPIVCLGNGEPL